MRASPKISPRPRHCGWFSPNCEETPRGGGTPGHTLGHRRYRSSRSGIGFVLLFLALAIQQAAFWHLAGPVPRPDPAIGHDPTSGTHAAVYGGRPTRPFPPAQLVHWAISPQQLDPHLPAEFLTDYLSTPLEAGAYLERHAQYRLAPSVVRFALDYRLSLRELQSRNWVGDCNDLANAICELVDRQGYPVSILTVWPNSWQGRLTKEWHQMAVLCVRANSCYVVFDNGRPVVWNGTLDGFVRHIGMEVLPVGGMIPWRPVKPNPLARFIDHLRWNSLPAPAQQPVDRQRTSRPMT